MIEDWRKATAICVTVPAKDKIRLKSVSFIYRQYGFHYVLDILDGNLYKDRDEIIKKVLAYAKNDHFLLPYYESLGCTVYDIFFMQDTRLIKYAYRKEV